MGHREVDRPRLDLLRPRGSAAGEPDARLRSPGDLDLLPREADATAERLADRLLAGEPRGVALRRVRPRVAVLPFRQGEAALAEARPLECAPDPVDLDQVEAGAHRGPRASARAIRGSGRSS